MAYMGFYKKMDGVPLILPFNLAVSMTINQGDLVTGVTDTGNNLTYVRKATAADIAASFTETSTKGFLGLACNDVITDANGFATTSVGFSGAGAGATAIMGLPSYDAGIDPDPDTGRSRTRVIIATEDTIFWGFIKAADTSTIIDTRLVGKMADITLASGNFALDTPGSGDAIVKIVGVDEQSNGYNIANSGTLGLGGRVFFTVAPNFREYTNGNVWWTA